MSNEIQPPKPEALSNPSELAERFPVIPPLIMRAGTGEGAILQVLEGVEQIYGYVPSACLDLVADAMEVSRGQMQWIATVLHPFNFEPGPEHSVRVCRGEACKMNGSPPVIASIKESISEVDQDSSLMAYDEFPCLGMCFEGPNLMLDGKIYNGVTPEQARRLIHKLRHEKDDPAK